VSQADFENALDSLKGAKLLLKRDPGVEATETIEKLVEPDKNKMALYMLSKSYVRDSVFRDRFFEADGLKSLIGAMLKTSGSTQALVLRCLVGLLESSGTTQLRAAEVGDDELAVILELCASETIATQKSALQLAAAIVGSQNLILSAERAVGKAG
jgi:hypothetical protein